MRAFSCKPELLTRDEHELANELNFVTIFGLFRACKQKFLKNHDELSQILDTLQQFLNSFSGETAELGVSCDSAVGLSGSEPFCWQLLNAASRKKYLLC